jgi:hypothetical protein
MGLTVEGDIALVYWGESILRKLPGYGSDAFPGHIWTPDGLRELEAEAAGRAAEAFKTILSATEDLHKIVAEASAKAAH